MEMSFICGNVNFIMPPGAGYCYKPSRGNIVIPCQENNNILNDVVIAISESFS